MDARIVDPLSDEARFPGLSAAGRALLTRLREHPHAPRYTAVCGHRLTPAYLERVRAFAALVEAEPPAFRPGQPPAWVADLVRACWRQVPFYRAAGGQPPAAFTDLPTCDRADLARAPWAFVPDDAPLDDLIWYATSGTTGHPLTVLSHPVAGASYMPLLQRALAWHGVTLTARRGQLGCVLVGWQQKAYTYASVTPAQDEAGHLKLNLHPNDWRDPDDRARFLDDCAPELYTGDPLAFAELARLPLRARPKALLSTAMTLLPGLRRELEARFDCPVIDVYSMNESGPIAARVGEAWRLLQPRLYVEILDAEGRVCPPGARGEVTLTGGFNPFLPLVRYRTSDYAEYAQPAEAGLMGLEGRAPVVYWTGDGRAINNLDVTGALRACALPQYTFHQAADGALTLRVGGDNVDLEPARAAVRVLFGARWPLRVESAADLAGPAGKVVQYTSDWPAEAGA